MQSERDNHINMIANLEHCIAQSSDRNKILDSNSFGIVKDSSKGTKPEDQVHPAQGTKRVFYSRPNRNKELEIARIALAQKLGYSV